MKDLDNIFREGLSQTQVFEGAEDGWAIVEKDLSTKPNGMLVKGGVGLLLISCLAIGIGYNQWSPDQSGILPVSDSEIQESVTQIEETYKEEIAVVPNKALEASIVNDKADLIPKQVSSPSPISAENIILDSREEFIQSETEKIEEPCPVCPEDEEVAVDQINEVQKLTQDVTSTLSIDQLSTEVELLSILPLEQVEVKLENSKSNILGLRANRPIENQKVFFSLGAGVRSRIYQSESKSWSPAIYGSVYWKKWTGVASFHKESVIANDPIGLVISTPIYEPDAEISNVESSFTSTQIRTSILYRMLSLDLLNLSAGLGMSLEQITDQMAEYTISPIYGNPRQEFLLGVDNLPYKISSYYLQINIEYIPVSWMQLGLSADITLQHNSHWDVETKIPLMIYAGVRF